MWAPRGVLVVVLLAAVAEAAPIRMQLSIEFTGDGFSTFQLIASNVGEEAAHQLAAETFFTGTSQTTDTLETLGPGQRHTWAASIPPPT